MRKDRFLVYEYDDSKQTPLHWAAWRGQVEVIKALIAKRSNINARDLIGRTPLFHASKMNNIGGVKALLAGRANPLLRTQAGGKTPYIVTKNRQIKTFLMKATLLKICLPMIANPRIRENVWESEGLYYFNNESDELDDFI